MLCVMTEIPTLALALHYYELKVGKSTSEKREKGKAN